VVLIILIVSLIGGGNGLLDYYFDAAGNKCSCGRVVNETNNFIPFLFILLYILLGRMFFNPEKSRERPRPKPPLRKWTPNANRKLPFFLVSETALVFIILIIFHLVVVVHIKGTSVVLFYFFRKRILSPSLNSPVHPKMSRVHALYNASTHVYSCIFVFVR